MDDRINIRLGRLMEKHGYTNQRMADETGIPIGTVSGIRSGSTQNPSFEAVAAMLIAMGESIDVFAGFASKPLKIEEEQLDADEYTETEKRAIMRWAGSEIARTYQALISALEARIAEKDTRINDKSTMLVDAQSKALEELHLERKRARQATWISYAALGLFVVLFFVDFLMPTRGWIIRQ